MMNGSMGQGLCPSRHYPTVVLSNRSGELRGLEHLISCPTGASVELIGWGTRGPHFGELILVFQNDLERERFILLSPELRALQRGVEDKGFKLLSSKSSFSLNCQPVTSISCGWFYPPSVNQSYAGGDVEAMVGCLLETQEPASVEAAYDVIMNVIQAESKQGCCWSRNRLRMGTCFSHASLGLLVERSTGLLADGGWYPEAMSVLKAGIEASQSCEAPSSRLVSARLLWCKWSLVLPHQENEQTGALDEFSKEILAYGDVAVGPDDRSNAAVHHLQFGRWCALAEIPGTAKLAAIHLDKAIHLGNHESIRGRVKYVGNAAIQLLLNAPRLTAYREYGLSIPDRNSEWNRKMQSSDGTRARQKLASGSASELNVDTVLNTEGKMELIGCIGESREQSGWRKSGLRTHCVEQEFCQLAISENLDSTFTKSQNYVQEKSQEDLSVTEGRRDVRVVNHATGPTNRDRNRMKKRNRQEKKKKMEEVW